MYKKLLTILLIFIITLCGCTESEEDSERTTRRDRSTVEKDDTEKTDNI